MEINPNEDKKLTRREFLILFSSLGAGFIGSLFLIKNFVEKRHLKGLWEVFKKEENKRALEEFIKQIFPQKNPKEIIERAYRVVLVEQYLLSFLEKVGEVLNIGKTRGLGQLSKETLEEFEKQIEGVKPQINNFLRKIFPDQNVSLENYEENPVVNFIWVMLLVEFLRKKGESYLENSIESALKLTEELSKDCDRFFNIEEDLKSRKEIALSTFKKLDDVYAIIVYSTKETSPFESWIQCIINIINLLEGKKERIKVDGDIGSQTIEQLKNIGIEKVNWEDKEFSIEIFWENENIERKDKIRTIQNAVYKLFKERYLDILKEFLRRLLAPKGTKINYEDKRLLIDLIKISYQLQIGYHSLIDEFLKIEVPPKSYWDEEIKKIELIKDEFHEKWFSYVLKGEKTNIFDLNYIIELIKRKANIEEEILIRHLARVLLIRISILLESKIEIPQQVLNRVSLYATLGEKI